LCDLYAKTNKKKGFQKSIIRWNKQEYKFPENNSIGNSNYLGQNVEAYLPTQVMKWAGLTFNNPDVIFEKEKLSLCLLNDYGLTFNQLANLIEKHL
jgi:hypothetical protein